MDDKTLKNIVDTVTRNVLEHRQNAETEYTKKYIALSVAKKLCARVEEEAARMGLNVVVAVANPGARPVVVECMDDSYIASYDIALNKAYTSAAVKMPTTTLKNLSQPQQSLYGIQFTNQGQIVVFGGGVPLMKNGELVGALGVSGGSAEQDTYLAQFATETFRQMTGQK